MTYKNALSKLTLLALTCIAFNLGSANLALAVEDTAVTQVVNAPPAAPVAPVTTTQTETENKVVSKNDQTRAARLAELSGKTKEEILKMRTEQHMGWGVIAKSLGVHPGELGQSIKKDRKEKNAASKLEKNESREQRLASKEKRHGQEDRKADHKSDK